MIKQDVKEAQEMAEAKRKRKPKRTLSTQKDDAALGQELAVAGRETEEVCPDEEVELARINFQVI